MMAIYGPDGKPWSRGVLPMNTQEQARKFAEGVELPNTVKLFEDENNIVVGYTEAQLREAIAAAYVKLMEGQEPVAYINDAGAICPTLHGVFTLKPGRDLYTHPAPSQQGELCEDEGCPHHGTKHICIDSQQEDRKPLTDDEAVEQYWGPLADRGNLSKSQIAEAIETAHGIKEQKK